MIAEEQADQAIAEVLGRHKREKKHLISLLQDLQATLGYLPRKGMQEIAGFLGMTEVDVWGVATFYNQFRFVPLGRCHTTVCLGTACHLAGGRLILDALERELDIRVGETSGDGGFSLERVACIGCCMLAPVVVIKDRIHSRMTPFKVEEALIPYKRECRGGPEE